MNTDIPPHVKNAIRELSEFANQNEYAEVIISHTGSASFTRHSHKEKKENPGVVGILAVLMAAIVFISSFVILGISLFKPLPEVNHGWMLILIGSSWLSVIVTVEPVFGKKETRDSYAITATFVIFVFLGLALLSKSPVLSPLFYTMAVSSLVFGRGFAILQKGTRQLQQYLASKSKV